MDNAAATDDATHDVMTSPARKRKRNMANGDSITSILVRASDMIFFLG